MWPKSQDLLCRTWRASFCLKRKRQFSRELADGLIHHLEHHDQGEPEFTRRLQGCRSISAGRPAPAGTRMRSLQTRLLVNNPSPVTKVDALAIYQAAY
ncbi:hypothetical protein ACU4HD_10540 [Cupriavidus basilensis]